MSPTVTNEIYPPLNEVNRTHVDTAAAAFYALRKEQTMRHWACYGTGPIQPQRVNGRLAWRVADLKKLMGVEQ